MSVVPCFLRSVIQRSKRPPYTEHPLLASLEGVARMQGRFSVTGSETRVRRSDGVQVTLEEWEESRKDTMWLGAEVGAVVIIVPVPDPEEGGSEGWRVGEVGIIMGREGGEGVDTSIGYWEK